MDVLDSQRLTARRNSVIWRVKEFFLLLILSDLGESEALVQGPFQGWGVVGENHRMDVELEGHARIAQFPDAVTGL